MPSGESRRWRSGSGRSRSCAHWASSAAMRSVGTEASDSRRTARSERTYATRSRRSGQTGSRPNGSTRPGACSREGSRPRSVTRPTARSNRPGSCGASPSGRRPRGSRSSRDGGSTDLTSSTPRRWSWRPTAIRAVCSGELEGLIVPTRGQVIATEPIAERLFDTPHYGRHGFDYWHQAEDGRIVAGGFRDVSLEAEFTDEETVTDDVQRALSAFVNEPRRTRAPGRLSLGGDLRGRARLPARRRPGARRLGRPGWPAATRATATCSGSPAGGSSRARSRATVIRCSTCSSRRGSWLDRARRCDREYGA